MNRRGSECLVGRSPLEGFAGQSFIPWLSRSANENDQPASPTGGTSRSWTASFMP